MIYLDTSVALAYLLAEDRYPSYALWQQPIVSSRLLECEIWNRINAGRLQDSHGDAVRGSDCHHRNGTAGLQACLEAVSRPGSHADAIHLAAIEFIRSRGASVQLATSAWLVSRVSLPAAPHPPQDIACCSHKNEILRRHNAASLKYLLEQI
jgi:hypothetical protein